MSVSLPSTNVRKNLAHVVSISMCMSVVFSMISYSPLHAVLVLFPSYEVTRFLSLQSRHVTRFSASYSGILRASFPW